MPFSNFLCDAPFNGRFSWQQVCNGIKAPRNQTFPVLSYKSGLMDEPVTPEKILD